MQNPESHGNLKSPATLFGRRLRAARQAAGIAQEALGAMMGLDETTSSARISRYETGASAPSFEIALKIAEKLSVPVEYFYCRSDIVARLLMAVDRLPVAEQKRVLMYAEMTLENRKAVRAENDDFEYY